VGYSELRERPAAASDGDRAWSGAVAVSRDQGGIGVQGRVIGVTDVSRPKKLAFSTRHSAKGKELRR
jgi:hypothetical protein